MFTKGDIVRISWMPVQEIDRVCSVNGIKKRILMDYIRTGLATIEDPKATAGMAIPNWAGTESRSALKPNRIKPDVVVVSLDVGEHKSIAFMPQGCVCPVFTI